jgi:hypothetical protein
MDVLFTASSVTPSHVRNSASVTMNEGIPRLVTRTPLNTPMAMPMHTARAKASQMCASLAPVSMSTTPTRTSPPTTYSFFQIARPAARSIPRRRAT